MDAEIGHEEFRSVVDAASDDEGAGDDVRVVDVRPPGAFARAHVPGSENVPMDDLIDDVERFGDADRVVTVCPHGQMSVRAARLIAAYESFDGRVESFEPGLTEWEGPLESGAASDGGTRGAGDESADEGPDAPF